MESGTDTACVYNLLLEEQRQEEFAKIQGRREVVIQVAILLATTIGGIMAGFSYELTYGGSILIMLISIAVLLQMKEIKNDTYEKTNIIKGMKLQVTQSYALIKKDHQIFYLMLSTSLFSATLATCYFYLTTYWSGLGVPIATISIILAIEHIVAMLAGIMTHRIIRKTSQRKLLLILPLGIVFSMLGISFYPISIIAICVMAFFETILYIAMTSFLNEKVASQFRATLLSTLSLGFSAVMILYFPFVGWIGELYGLKVAYLCLFVLVLFIYILYQHIIRKKFN